MRVYGRPVHLNRIAVGVIFLGSPPSTANPCMVWSDVGFVIRRKVDRRVGSGSYLEIVPRQHLSRAAVKPE